MSKEPSSMTSVAVIGGGPAGSTVAAILAKQGIDVVVLEREAFPRYHIGESLLPSIMTVADITGARKAIEDFGFVKKPGAYLEWGQEAWSLVFGELSGIPSHSYQVTRADFDKILLDNARDQGAVVKERCRVNSVELDGEDGPIVHYDDLNDSSSVALRCDFIVDCSGRAGIIAHKTKNQRKSHDVFKNFALWSYWSGVDFADLGQSGSIRVFSTSDGWVWMIPLHDNTVSVGVVLHKDSYLEKRKSTNMDAIYHDALMAIPSVREVLAQGEYTDVKMETDYSYTSDSFAGRGYFVAGDAACFLDPLLSSGVHLATFSGMLAAASITSVARKTVSVDQAIDYYEKCYRQAYLRFLVFVSAFYDQARGQDGYFWEAQRLSRSKTTGSNSLKQAFISLVSGLEDYGDTSEAVGDLVLGAIADRVRENIDLRKDKDNAKVGSLEADENNQFFDAIEGLFALSEENAINGLYVKTVPEVHLAAVSAPTSSAVLQGVEPVSCITA